MVADDNHQGDSSLFLLLSHSPSERVVERESIFLAFSQSSVCQVSLEDLLAALCGLQATVPKVGQAFLPGQAGVYVTLRPTCIPCVHVSARAALVCWAYDKAFLCATCKSWL